MMAIQPGAEIDGRTQSEGITVTRTTDYAAELHEFGKGNLDAIAETGRIFSAGLRDMAKAAAEDGKAAVETMAADAREFGAVQSSAEFIQLQSAITRRNLDTAVAQLSRSTEMWVKLAGDVAAPISTRASLAMEKIRKAA